MRDFALERALPGYGEQDPYVLECSERVVEALCDDFNTPRALAAIFDLVAEGNRRDLPGAIEALGTLLPLLGLEALLVPADEPDEGAVALLNERERARQAKDFERADEIREELAGLGWKVRDSADGARLVR
jgi:cysteinyl-tRNA synthetase